MCWRKYLWVNLITIKHMHSHELAWKGITVEEKRELLTTALQGESLYLGSTCIDIMSTAQAAIKEGKDTAEWQELLGECRTHAEKVIAEMVPQSKEGWEPSNYEIVGTLLLRLDRPVEAKSLFEEGIVRAQENVPMKALLEAQMIRVAIGENDIAEVMGALDVLQHTLREGDFDPTVLTRVHRALAEGHKFLAIRYAEDAELDNQVMKARAV
jgi:hypothetical protein